MERVRMAFAVIVLLFLLVSCAALEKVATTYSDMTSKEKVVFFMDAYNSQYEDYKSVAAMPNLSEEQKEFLRKKKEVLQLMYPLIETYAIAVQGGTAPSKETEREILKLINLLSSEVA